jgi:hypothetical protein
MGLIGSEWLVVMGNTNKIAPTLSSDLQCLSSVNTVAVRESGPLHPLLALIDGVKLLASYEDDANLF